MRDVLVGYDNRFNGATLSGGSWSGGSFGLDNLKDPDISLAARTATIRRRDTWFRCKFGANYTLRALGIKNHTCSARGRVRMRVSRSPFDLVYDSEDTGGILDERVTYTGDTNGTRVNKRGAVVRVTRTNLLLHSGDFNNAAYIKTGLTTLANQATSPENTVTMAKLTETVANSEHVAFQTATPSASGQPLTFSVTLKAGTVTRARIGITGTVTAAAWVWIDLTTGEVLDVGAGVTNLAVEPNGAGAWRFGITTLTTGTNVNGAVWLTGAESTTIYPGSTSNYLYAWGAQLEENGDMTEYVATAAATVTATQSGRMSHDVFRTNLFKHSENVLKSTWSKLGVFASVDDIASYTGGTSTPFKLVEDASNGHTVSQTVTNVSTTATYTASGYFKQGGRKYVRIQIAGAAGNFVYANFELNSGAVSATIMGGTGSGVAASISAAGNGWFRCMVSGAPGSGTNVQATFQLLNDAQTGVYAGDGASAIYVADLQLEPSAAASAYIATTFLARTVADVCGLLPEGAVTNLLVRSAEFDNASWLNGGGGVTANQLTSPEGAATADMLTIAGAGTGLIYQLVAVTASTAYTFSVHARMGSIAEGDYKLAFYDATAGAFIAQDVVPSSIVVGNGWRRYYYTVTTPVGCTSMRAYAFRNSALAAGTVYLWGAQLEVGTEVTSYVPTAAANATRTASGCIGTGANFTGWFTSPLAFTMFVRTRCKSTVTDPVTRVPLAIGDSATFNESFYMSRQASSANIAGSAVDGGVGQWVTPVLGAVAPGAFFNAAISFEVNNLSGCVNGGAINQDTSATLPTVNTIAIGNGSWSGAGNWWGELIQRVTVWPEATSHARLKALTTDGPDQVTLGGYDSGWQDALQFTFTAGEPAAWGEQYDLMEVFSAIEAGYATVEFDDPYNTAAFLDLGRAYAMSGVQPAYNASFSGFREYREDLSTVTVSVTGKQFATERRRRRCIDFAFNWNTQAEADHIHELQDKVGVTGEALFIPWAPGKTAGDRATNQRYGFLGELKELSPIEYPFVKTRSVAMRGKEKL